MQINLRAFCIHGFAGAPWPGCGPSVGMGSLASTLTEAGIRATAHSHGILWYENVPSISNLASDAARAGHKIILVGHSMGANAATRVACSLALSGHKVALLAALDPVEFCCPQIPNNVERAMCFTGSINWIGGILRPNQHFPAGRMSHQFVHSTHRGIDDHHEIHQSILS